MDKAEYKFKALEDKYGGFLGPAFTITVGSTEIDSSKVPISSLSVDIDSGGAGGCRFVLEAMYDYENSKWASEMLDTIEVGAKITIQAGYVAKKQIFFGFVDDFTIEYSSEGAPRLSVNGIDAKGYLMSAKGQKYLSKESTKSVIEAILNECVSKGYAESVDVGAITEYEAELIKTEIDDYKFLLLLAGVYNMQFVVINGEIIFKHLMSDTKAILTLTLGVSLLSFSKKMSLKNQVGKVVVYGIDPKTKKPISGEASSTSISGGSGEEASGTATSFSGVTEKESNMFVSTPEECQTLAQARFDARAFEYVKGSGKCIGIPEIIPGRYIELEGLDDRSSDTYFITKATHDYSSEQGYFTSFEVKGAKSK